jgi:tRNA G46 methylase TrmB
MYSNLLLKNGQIFFKTDQKKLYDFLIDELPKVPTLALIQETIYKDNDIMTEYETKFTKLNQPIYKIVLVKK